MRFLVDECVARPIVAALRDHFSDVVSVREEAPGTVDMDILSWANRDQRVLVTEDYDFGELTYRELQPAFGIVIIAPGVFRGDVEGMAGVIATRIADLKSGLEGSLTIIERLRTRQRKL